MRSPKDFFAPLAVGAPEPVRRIPALPSRTVHFSDPPAGPLRNACDAAKKEALA